MSQLETLIKINCEDILGAVGLKEVRRGRRLLEWLCRPPAKRFASQVLDCDRRVGEVGLEAAATHMLHVLHNQLVIRGAETLPSDGSLFFLANHPGLTDTLALFASIPRSNLRVIAADRPFLRALPNTSQHLIYVDEAATHNLAAVRAGVAHLCAGGSLLTFPGGSIEPDPALAPGAIDALARWSESVTLFAKLTPTTRFVPVLVSGVLNPMAQRSPLRLLRRTQKDREWLAAMLQLLVPAYQAVTVQVRFAPAIAGCDFQGDGHGLMAEIRNSMRRMIEG